MMYENDDALDAQLTELFQVAFTLPDDRIDALSARLEEQIEAENPAYLWQAFTTVMVGRLTEWCPVYRAAVQPWRYRCLPTAR